MTRSQDDSRPQYQRRRLTRRSSRLNRGKNNREMAALWKGDSTGLPSTAAGDLALCAYPALCTRNDEARIMASSANRRYRDDGM